MIVLQIKKLSKSFGEQEVLKGVSLAVQEKERVGLVGLNGSGKTTLLRCMTGELQPDAGEVMISSALSLGCLEQMPDSQPGMTAWDAVMESFADLIDKRRQMRELENKMGQAESELDKLMEQYARITEEYEQDNGYACENMARRILIGLGFDSDEFQQPLATFSGGQKTRLNLGRLLALAPDILLLDEPTNHLDMGSVEWLEDFIKGYAGTVLVVSHDRMFLDRVATHIAEIRGGELKAYAGNYSAYLHKRAVEDLAEQRAYEKQQVHIQQTEDYIRRFKAGIKSKQARGRQSQLDRLERMEGPINERHLRRLQININQESGNDVLTIAGLNKSYQESLLLKNISFKIKKGDKIALIGPNGCGKTTLLKIISGQIPADQGEIRLGSRVEIACFSQEHEDLNLHHTVLDEIVSNFDLTLQEARTALGGMLFREDEVFKMVGDLSGGELGRLAFLKVILSRANFLLLDEPTNHLDIASCQVVERMLADFAGTVLVVSHDRYFIDQVADQVLDIEDGRAEYYRGNYSYYYEKKQEKEKNLLAEQRETKEKVIRPDLQLREEEKERKRIRRRLNQELDAIEASIMEIEQRKAELESLLSDTSTYNDEEKARNLNTEYRQIEQSLRSGYEQWEHLHEELDEHA
ncbi:MAG: ABC-F family ATP-binding cassette domain-containing protein [Syntrophomonas sp.]|nr:ABC-F family ATP-binding cassette domain-containing protein [Syntrophomonas sp.]